MIGQLTYAEGAPCPTLVLDARDLPREQHALLGALSAIRRWLSDGDHAQVLKIALIEPSASPASDLDYRFIQAWPDDPDRFDLRGSCGHSILGAVLASPEFGMRPALAAGQRTRVNVTNNGDRVICQVDHAADGVAVFEIRFRFAPPKPAADLLLTRQPRTELDVDGERVAVSLVSAGNPYVFVAGASVGAPTADALFGGGQELLDRLVRIRAAAAVMLGWPLTGAFPKAAAVIGTEHAVAVRAVSVPGWHPTLALTGSVCLAAATRIAQTIPWLAARPSSGSRPDPGGGRSHGTYLLTPKGRWPVSITTAMLRERPRIAEVTVGQRQVSGRGSLRIDLPALLPRSEVPGWLPRSA